MEALTTSPWYVISLRPRGEHAPMRRAAARRGGGVVALSPWRLQPRTDASTRQDLEAALGAPRVVFTSPTAVRAAMRLCAGNARALADAGSPASRWIGVGAGTAAALRRAGIAAPLAPTRMDSEGVLALPALQDVAGAEVGLVSAPGGRDAIAPALQARGARVLRADVYDRVPLPPSPATTSGSVRRRATTSAGAVASTCSSAPTLLAASTAVPRAARRAASARGEGGSGTRS